MVPVGKGGGGGGGLSSQSRDTPTRFAPVAARGFTPAAVASNTLQAAMPGNMTSSDTITPVRGSFMQPVRSNDAIQQRTVFDRLEAEGGLVSPCSNFTNRIPHLGNGRDGILSSSPFGPTRVGTELLRENRCHRAFQIENVAGVSQVDVVDMFRFPSVRGLSNLENGPAGKFAVAFSDSRDADWTRELIPRLEPKWRLIPITTREFAERVHADASKVSDYEGVVRANVYHDPRTSTLAPADMKNSLRSVLELLGEVISVDPVERCHPNIFEFQVEFYDIHAAEAAICSFNCVSFEGCVLEVLPHRPDVDARHVRPSGVSRTSDPYSRTLNSRASRSSCLHPSPAGFFNSPESDDDTDSMTVVPGNGSPMPRHRGSRAAGNQIVDIERIRLGLDVRTTVMLRNIPNRMSQVALKRLLDETSRGKFDFMYLRFDFEKRCNVGYAFVNFADPLDIIPFVNARADRKWDSFSSEKIAEIRYATIQGKDRLIQKFRNSGVMRSNPEYRPKLYATGNGPLAGRELEFPEPDDYAKLNRSIANTNCNGLYGPRSSTSLRRGQLPRDMMAIAARREVPHSVMADAYAGIPRPGSGPSWELLPFCGRS